MNRKMTEEGRRREEGKKEEKKERKKKKKKRKERGRKKKEEGGTRGAGPQAPRKIAFLEGFQASPGCFLCVFELLLVQAFFW